MLFILGINFTEQTSFSSSFHFIIKLKSLGLKILYLIIISWFSSQICGSNQGIQFYDRLDKSDQFIKS